ncbi:MAG: endonuclease/exonuclease/phosphatase family protein [Ferruginibacter sp.]|nr:endonuclease/exonuclease/phosphatase family protein [Ferruginibacter sp.]
MPPFPKPSIAYKVDVTKEIKNIALYQKNKPDRKIPAKKKNKLLLATWNIANLGTQKREAEHYKIIAEMLSWFDIIAIQEINDNLEGLRHLQKELPSNYQVIFTDASGNNERMCFMFNNKKVKQMEKIGEIAVAVEDLADVKLPEIKSEFKGFSRSPFLATFKINNFVVALINAHSYFGDESKIESIERRSLEAYCIARWADLRRKSKNCYTPNIIALGDFNLPKIEPGDLVYKALLARGFEIPEHSTKIYSNISNDMHYDQIVFMPGLKSLITNTGVFDFDGALFTELWNKEKPNILKNYLRYYISDHRIKWIEISAD